MLQVKPLRGLNTAWIQEGTSDKDPILLFVHGFPDSPMTWKNQIDYFSKSYTTLAPYARGIGLSENTDDTRRFSLESVTLDYLEILRETDPSGTRPVLVIGHDIGSIYAWNLARLLKERLHGLVIINGVSLDQMARRLKNPRQVLKSWYIAFFQVPGVPDYILKKWKSPMLRWMRKMGGAPSHTAVVEDISAALYQYRENFKRLPKELLTRHQKLKAPVLVLFGKEDPALEIPTSRELEKIAENFTIRILDSSHWVHEQNPDHVNRLIEEFICTSPKNG